jgi:hypothetical protein
MLPAKDLANLPAAWPPVTDMPDAIDKPKVVVRICIPAPEDLEPVRALSESNDNLAGVNAAHRPHAGRSPRRVGTIASAITRSVTRRVDRLAKQAALRDRQLGRPCAVEPASILDTCNAGRGGSAYVDDASHRQVGSSTTIGEPAPAPAGVATGHQRRHGKDRCRPTDAPGHRLPRHDTSAAIPRGDSGFASATHLRPMRFPFNTAPPRQAGPHATAALT